MTTTAGITADEILELCSQPITCIRQIAWKSDTATNAAGKMNVWGGQTPIIAVCFDKNNSCLFVGATDTSLVLRLAHIDDYDAVISLANQIGESDYNDEELVGVFDLDSVVCPVPEWEVLDITKASVITATKNNVVIGICFTVNLGIRIGMFVNPFPGITLSFNDTCDLILRQAEQARQNGLVQFYSKEYPSRETPKQIDTIAWFDWLYHIN